MGDDVFRMPRVICWVGDELCGRVVPLSLASRRRLFTHPNSFSTPQAPSLRENPMISVKHFLSFTFNISFLPPGHRAGPELYITRHGFGYTRRTTSTSTQRTPSYKTQCIAQPFLALTPHVSHRPRKPSFRRYLQSIQTDFPATTMPLLLPQDAIQHGRLWREHSIQRVWARSRCPCDAHAMPAITS